MNPVYILDHTQDQIDCWALQRLFHRLPIQNIVGLQIYRTRTTSQGVDVYLLDSLPDLKHPEFKENSDIHVLDEVHPQEASAHGTATASLIVGKNLGLATQSRLFISPCFNQYGRCSSSDLQEALQRVLRHRIQELKTNPEAPTAICCLPLVTKCSQLQKLIQEITKLNILCVCAAGDKNSTVEEFFPANLDETLTVGACDKHDQLAENFSVNINGQAKQISSNKNPDLMAPGVDLSVALPQEQYNLRSGSSLSAALVAGLAAHFSNQGHSSPADLKQALLDTATPSESSAPVAFYPYSAASFRWYGAFHIGTLLPGSDFSLELPIEDLDLSSKCEVELLKNDLPFELKIEDGYKVSGHVPKNFVELGFKQFIFPILVKKGSDQQQFKLTLTLKPNSEYVEDNLYLDAHAAFKSINLTVCVCACSCGSC